MNISCVECQKGTERSKVLFETSQKFIEHCTKEHGFVTSESPLGISPGFEKLKNLRKSLSKNKI
jgi:hypothetical protein